MKIPTHATIQTSPEDTLLLKQACLQITSTIRFHLHGLLMVVVLVGPERMVGGQDEKVLEVVLSHIIVTEL